MTQEPYRRSERRKTPRKKAEFKVEYTLHIDLTKKKGAFRVNKIHSADISGGGLAIYSDISDPLKIEKEIYLIIKLPKRKKEIYAHSKVIYVSQIDQGPGVSSG